jgi:hypothetical protein
VNILAADRPARARAFIQHAGTAGPVATGRATVIVRCTAPPILTALTVKTRLVRTAANAIADIIAAGSIYAQTRAAIDVAIAGVAARNTANTGVTGCIADP